MSEWGSQSVVSGLTFPGFTVSLTGEGVVSEVI